MEQTQPAHRIVGLDLIKSLGLILVIYYHLVFQSPPDLTGLPGLFDYLSVYLRSFLCCCVPLFFMSSGALALSRPVELKKNSMRCAHLLVLTGFWVIACTAGVLLLRREQVGLGTFLHIAWDIKIGYIQHLWYLPNFLFLSLMAPVLSALKTGNRKIYRYLLGIIAFFTFGNILLNDGEYVIRWILGKQGHSTYRTFFGDLDFFRHHYWYIFVYFALGSFLMEYSGAFRQRKRRLVPVMLLAMLCLTVIAAAYAKVMGVAYDHVFHGYSSIFTLVLSSALFLLLIDLKPGGVLQRIAASLSNCSLGIYIIHWLVWEAFVQLLPDITKNTAFALPMTVIIGLISWGITLLGLKLPLLGNLFTAAPAWMKNDRFCEKKQ